MAECRSDKCKATIVFARPDGGGPLMPVDVPATRDPFGEPCAHEGDLIVWLAGGQWHYRSAGKCTRCGHKLHEFACAKRGKVECRQVGGVRVRGQWPCGCPDGEAEVPAPGEHRATSHYATCIDAASWRSRGRA